MGILGWYDCVIVLIGGGIVGNVGMWVLVFRGDGVKV